MKRFFREAVALGALAALVLPVGCTRDFEELSANDLADVNQQKIILTSQGASAGVLAVKVSPERAAQIEAAQTRSGTTRSGVESIDAPLDQIAATTFKRIFCDPLFEQELREAGLHLWYKVSFDQEQELQQAARALAGSEDITVVEYMHHPQRPQRPYIAPAAGSFELTRAEDEEEEEEFTYPMDDDHLPLQWHYHNRGLITGSKAGSDINLFPAWKLCTGNEDIVVAVIDEPVQSTHPDLEKNMWVNTVDGDSKYKHGANFCTTESEPIALDWNWRTAYGDTPSHGTHIAGTIAAVNGNGIGVCGIAGGYGDYGGVKIMSCQIFQEDGEVNYAQEDSSSRALIWAANRGALIAQCSFGYNPTITPLTWERDYSFEKEAIDYFISRKRTNAPIDGGLVIFAAGNDGNSTVNGMLVKDKELCPGSYSPTIAVASIGPDFLPACYTCYGDWVDISAPGGESQIFDSIGMVYSTIIPENWSDNVQYGYMEGSSMACPHVSGVAALGLSYAADLGKHFTTEEFRGMLLSSTREIDSYFEGVKRSMGINYNTQSYTEVVANMASYRNKMGGGVVDAFRMLMAIEGTPMVTVTHNQECTLPLQSLFGGEALTTRFEVEVVEDKEAADEIGLSYSVAGNEIKVLCGKIGSSRLTLKCQIGDTEVSRTLAVICREQNASNGGWL